MKFYKCKVRLGGNLHNEVDKIGVSAPEVIVLRVIHGADSVVNIKEIAEKQVKHPEERARLAGLYNNPPGLVASLFGPPHQPLPLEAPDILAEAPVDESEPVEKPVLPAKDGDLSALTG